MFLAATRPLRHRCHCLLQGTMSHISPEVLTSGKASKASDVYAMGIFMWWVPHPSAPPADRHRTTPRTLPSIHPPTHPPIPGTCVLLARSPTTPLGLGCTMPAHCAVAPDEGVSSLCRELATGGRAFAGTPRALLGHQIARQHRRPQWPSDVHPDVAAASTPFSSPLSSPFAAQQPAASEEPSSSCCPDIRRRYCELATACWAPDPKARCVTPGKVFARHQARACCC